VRNFVEKKSLMIPWGMAPKENKENSNCLSFWWMDEGWMKLKTQR
jgi:hypothetical protein